MNIRGQVSRRATAVVAVLVAALPAAACGSGSDSSGTAAPEASSSGATHGGHDAAGRIPPAVPLRAGERFVTLKLPQPYTPQAPHGGTDEYRCFLMNPEVTGQGFLTGSQFLPQNADLVHHAIFFRIDAGDVAQARKVDAASQGDGWTCFGDSGVADDAGWVGHWAPGANETLLDAGLGYPMPRGSRLVMQVHYNLLASGGRAGGSDQSAVRLRLADGKEDLEALETGLLPAPVELPCAAGESGALCDRKKAVRDVAKRFGADAGEAVDELNQLCNQGKAPVAGTTQRCDHEVPEAAVVHALAGHMHLLGRSIRVELNPDTAKARTLLDIPAYDFDDQAIRPLADSVAVKPGDKLRVTCTHDAGLRQRLPALLQLSPRYVVWGDGTSDEMCLGILIWSRS